MDFKEWILTESSLKDLYKSSVDAFPDTTKRQHAVDPIKVTSIRWLPYLGVRTLFVKAEVRSEDRHYNPMVLFKNVQYHNENAKGLVRLAVENRIYFLEQLSLVDTDALLRCQCNDFKWRFQHFDKLDRSLYGSNRKRYEALHNPGSANPEELPGMCKHLMKLMNILEESGIVN